MNSPKTNKGREEPSKALDICNSPPGKDHQVRTASMRGSNEYEEPVSYVSCYAPALA